MVIIIYICTRTYIYKTGQHCAGSLTMMHLNNLITALMLAVLAAVAAVPRVHAYSGTSASGDSGQARALQSQADLQLQPGIIVDGFVLGEASAGEQTLLASGVARSRQLLHGSRRPQAYPMCNQCLLLECSKNRCSGHCRRGKKLFDCKSKGLPLQPARKPASKPASKPSSKPAAKPARKPAAKPASKPAPRKAPKPTQKLKRSSSPPQEK